MPALLPDAEYFVLASRLVPDRDAGFGIAVMRRALAMREAGAHPTLLTVDPGARDAHDADRAEWTRRGLLADSTRLRNLFDDVRADAAWLRAAALPAPIPATDLPYRKIVDAAGRTVLELPVVKGVWQLTDAPVRVWDETGPMGWLPGYVGLYRAWLNSLAAGAARPVVVVCEARQVGEALVAPGQPALDAGIRILHATHACHVQAPFTWDAPMAPAWERWLAVADRFDGVLWLTESQRRDVERRVDGIRSFVVPHAAPSPRTDVRPVPARIVMFNSLIPRKRVDHALRAFARVHGAVAHSRLHIYGDGPERGELETLAAALGVAESVTFEGQVADTADAWANADVLVLTSTNEGQGLVVLEALAHGVPVVAYDVSYGPRDTLAQGGGMLVPDGDLDALAATIRAVISAATLRDRLSREGRAAARALGVPSSMRALGDAVRVALDDPVTR